jgi:hypothetical protein
MAGTGGIKRARRAAAAPPPIRLARHHSERIDLAVTLNRLLSTPAGSRGY